MDPVRVYRSDQHRFFDDVFNMLVSYLAFGSAALAYMGRDATYRGTDKVEVTGKALGFGFTVRPSAILSPIVEDSRPDLIELQEIPWAIEWGSLRASGPRREPRRILTLVIHAAFVHYYETIVEQIESAFGRRRSHWHDWPEVLRFGMVVRDAFTHGGTLDIKGKTVPSIRWRDLSYSPADKGRQVLYGDLMPADLIVLMEEMDAVIPR